MTYMFDMSYKIESTYMFKTTYIVQMMCTIKRTYTIESTLILGMTYKFKWLTCLIWLTSLRWLTYLIWLTRLSRLTCLKWLTWLSRLTCLRWLHDWVDLHVWDNSGHIEVGEHREDTEAYIDKTQGLPVSLTHRLQWAVVPGLDTGPLPETEKWQGWQLNYRYHLLVRLDNDFTQCLLTSLIHYVLYYSLSVFGRLPQVSKHKTFG